MSVALLFPGQGSQHIGMGKELAQFHSGAARVFKEADRILGFKLSEIMWEGSESELQQTKYAQPAIMIHSVATFSAIEDLFEESLGCVQMAAGHSLGEFSAHVAAGSLSFADAVQTVKKRADLMQHACLEKRGTMAAIIGMGDEDVVSICQGVGSARNQCVAANFNSPNQVVISGDQEAVKEAMELALELGAQRAVQLNVSGAFHSHLMEPATDKFAEWIHSIEFRASNFPVVSNVTGKISESQIDGSNLLIKQLTSPVLWAPSIKYMVQQGITKFLEVGPGVILRGLNRRITRDTMCKSAGTPKDFGSLAEFFAESLGKK